MTPIPQVKVPRMMFTQSYSMHKSKYSMKEKAVFPSVRGTDAQRRTTETRKRLDVSTKGRSEREGIPPRKCLVPWEWTPFLPLLLTKVNVYALSPRQSLSCIAWSLTQPSLWTCPSNCRLTQHPWALWRWCSCTDILLPLCCLCAPVSTLNHSFKKYSPT